MKAPEKGKLKLLISEIFDQSEWWWTKWWPSLEGLSWSAQFQAICQIQRGVVSSGKGQSKGRVRTLRSFRPNERPDGIVQSVEHRSVKLDFLSEWCQELPERPKCRLEKIFFDFIFPKEYQQFQAELSWRWRDGHGTKDRQMEWKSRQTVRPSTSDEYIPPSKPLWSRQNRP